MLETIGASGAERLAARGADMNERRHGNVSWGLLKTQSRISADHQRHGSIGLELTTTTSGPPPTDSSIR